MSWQVEDGKYPIQQFWTEDPVVPDRSSIPSSVIRTDGSYPSFSWWTQQGDIIAPPYPTAVMFVDGSYPKVTVWDNPGTLIGAPYPDSVMFVLGRSYPKVNAWSDFELGSFTDCGDLNSITIPSSIQKIGPYAFKGTKLTQVRVPKGCYYQRSAFPDGCKIILY